jgi:hypothetical protein
MPGSQEQIGYVCYKGPHPSFIGDPDYGACGSKEFARIYVVVESERLESPRGETYSAEEAAEAIRQMAVESDAHSWCREDKERYEHAIKRVFELCGIGGRIETELNRLGFSRTSSAAGGDS